MRITVVGTGYVGLVTGACLSETGNHVTCVDKDKSKIDALLEGRIPIYEPGLERIVRTNAAAGRLEFTTDLGAAVRDSIVVFIAVGTPPLPDGNADLSAVDAVAREVGRAMNGYRIIVDKSTVPVGTAKRVKEIVGAESSHRFSVVSNPEFLKEGAAVADFMRPDRIIVGNDDHRATVLLRNLYAPFNRNHDRLIEMDVRSAELTKYAANAMLATKISFMNEMANLAERLGADIEKVRIGIGADPRIGYHFIYPGAGYGGSCFPKDVKALEYTARSVNYEAALLQAVEAVNEPQKTVLFTKIQRHFQNELRGRTFALWGLAFKPGTDDMREAPSRVLLEALWREGAAVRAYDPAAMDEARRLYGERPDFQLCDQPVNVLEGADALVIMTEWSLFRSPDFEVIRQALKQPVIFDGRNLYDPEYLREQGFIYYAIGRGETA